MFMKRRGELIFDEMIPWIIVIGVLVAIGIFFLVVSGKGEAAIEFFRNLWRFGR